MGVTQIDEWLERHRVELTAYSYRMLGSAFEAEDAVQEALTRAWRNIDQYDENRASLRTWLYRITTNVCFDMLRSAQRRARAMDLGPAATLGDDLGASLPESQWIQPIPDDRVLPESGDPAELAAVRETIRLAFVAALQHLAPRQRAVLILREVLCWKAAEVAHLLDTSVASVNSALQRARATLESHRPSPADPYEPMDTDQQRLLAKYVEAFERHDVGALVRMLHEDATMTMPPFGWWLRGRDAIRQAMSATDVCANDRLLPTSANGSPAFGQYRPGPDGYRPFSLVVLQISDGLITDTTTYLEPDRLFGLFGLPAELPNELLRG